MISFGLKVRRVRRVPSFDACWSRRGGVASADFAAQINSYLLFFCWIGWENTTKHVKHDSNYVKSKINQEKIKKKSRKNQKNQEKTKGRNHLRRLLSL